MQDPLAVAASFLAYSRHHQLITALLPKTRDAASESLLTVL